MSAAIRAVFNLLRCCLTSTETLRTIRDREPRTATSTFTQLLGSENSQFIVPCCFTSTETVRATRDSEPRTSTSITTPELKARCLLDYRIHTNVLLKFPADLSPIRISSFANLPVCSLNKSDRRPLSSDDRLHFSLKCFFASTETVGLLGTGAQDVHLDFHTAPELCPPFLGALVQNIRQLSLRG